MENDEDFALEGAIDSDDEEEIQITPTELVNMIEEMWINEKFAPEVLPHKYDVVLCMLDQINCMEGNLETLDNSDFKKNLHKLEVDRLRYMVTSYLRIRLQKIEECVFYILKQEEERTKNGQEPYLSVDELQYAKNYSDSWLY